MHALRGSSGSTDTPCLLAWPATAGWLIRGGKGEEVNLAARPPARAAGTSPLAAAAAFFNLPASAADVGKLAFTS
ncbi:hypothetical protein V5799_014235 [Amblyomma americanum]|uniref:Uncharacterized protein n=1 Tax=Amblyomma americanum TaxID=6943 RepID=A0AAQ4E3L9_AMBAM